LKQSLVGMLKRKRTINSVLLLSANRIWVDCKLTEQVAKYFDVDAEWDSDSEEAAKWIREIAVRYGVA